MTALGDAFRLEGRVAVVTGGAGMIGRSLSFALAEAGATVVVASRSLPKCQLVADEIAAAGFLAEALPLDLADEASIEALSATVLERHGGADILVNNAISRVPGHVETYPTMKWEQSMAIDATGYFRLTQLCLNAMLEKGGGNIITIASILGMVAAEVALYPAGIESFRPNYFYAKAGVVGFTRFIATAYAERNIRANCISPGGISAEEPVPQSAFAGRVPMKRLGRPDELKGAVLFLASDASAYVTGHNLVVDGGYTAW